MNRPQKTPLRLLTPFAIIAATSVLVIGDEVYYGNNYGSRASTVGESRARGFSDVVRSMGETNVKNSEAAINYTEVRSKELDNNLKQANTYFEMKKVNKEYRFGTPEEKAARREKNLEKQMFRHVKGGRPKRPSTSQLDPVTGKIRWPLLLRESKYNKHRKYLDEKFSKRAYNGGAIDYDTFRRIKRVTDSMLAILNRDIGKYTVNEYSESKRFIQALVYEARHSTL